MESKYDRNGELQFFRGWHLVVVTLTVTYPERSFLLVCGKRGETPMLTRTSSRRNFWQERGNLTREALDWKRGFHVVESSIKRRDKLELS